MSACAEARPASPFPAQIPPYRSTWSGSDRSTMSAARRTLRQRRDDVLDRGFGGELPARRPAPAARRAALAAPPPLRRNKPTDGRRGPSGLVALRQQSTCRYRDRANAKRTEPRTNPPPSDAIPAPSCRRTGEAALQMHHSPLIQLEYPALALGARIDAGIEVGAGRVLLARRIPLYHPGLALALPAIYAAPSSGRQKERVDLAGSESQSSRNGRCVIA